MKKIKLFFLALAMLVSSVAYAQNMTVKGVVKDSSTGEGVPFASLQGKGTMTGTSSDADGFYSIEVPSDGVIIFSSVGYVTLEVSVHGQAQHDVLLDPDTEAIEETIVVAFGTATKESFTGSATVVKSGDIAKVQASDATRALEGVVAVQGVFHREYSDDHADLPCPLGAVVGVAGNVIVGKVGSQQAGFARAVAHHNFEG